MKRAFYIICFGVLGLLVQMFAHAGIELFVLQLMPWDAWHPFWHLLVGVALFVAGLVFGLQQGVYWWDQIYVKKRYGWIK